MANILAVDDSVSIRQLVSLTLQAAGHQVTVAKDGSEALTLAKGNGAFQVFITDLNMPVMDGIALVKNLRALDKYKHTPILLLTTELDPAKKAAAKTAGATGWMVKPFDPEQLLATIRKVCG
jgi:two-component system chemotaxis response regulator CheY